ncbi:MAG: hypothetical protein ABSA83_06595 [Verrucomicrobiota bacterium]
MAWFSTNQRELALADAPANSALPGALHSEMKFYQAGLAIPQSCAKI